LEKAERKCHPVILSVAEGSICRKEHITEKSKQEVGALAFPNVAKKGNCRVATVSHHLMLPPIEMPNLPRLTSSRPLLIYMTWPPPPCPHSG
jgi:hypothetical protein